MPGPRRAGRRFARSSARRRRPPTRTRRSSMATTSPTSRRRTACRPAAASISVRRSFPSARRWCGSRSPSVVPSNLRLRRGGISTDRATTESGTQRQLIETPPSRRRSSPLRADAETPAWLGLQSPLRDRHSDEEDAMADTLYRRLGGYDGIAAFADNLLPRLTADPQLGRFWKHRGDDGVRREKQLLIDFLCASAGGPLYYVGRDMKTSHRGMGVSEQDWQVFLPRERHARRLQGPDAGEIRGPR